MLNGLLLINSLQNLDNNLKPVTIIELVFIISLLMLPTFKIDEITKKILESLPIDPQALEKDLKEKIKLIIQASLSKLDLITREEFDIQTQVLAKTREKVETLEQQIRTLIKDATKP